MPAIILGLMWKDLLPGQDWWTEIKKIIDDPYNLTVVYLSRKSITKRGVVQMLEEE